jgi:penicillin-binding protein 2
LLILTAFILIGRLYYLQIKNGEYYYQLSQNNYVRIITINPPRGRIFDRNGLLIAYDVPYYELYVIPYMVKKNWETLKKNIEKYLNIEITQDIDKKVKEGFSQRVIIKQRLSEDQLKIIYYKFYKFSGLLIDVVPRRHYTEYAKYMSHILGYVGYPSKEDLQNNPDINIDVLIGKSGVEKIYDKYLRGEFGTKAVVVDALGRIKKVLYEKHPTIGKDIYLTIDARMQKEAYEQFEKSGQKSGSVVIVDAKTYEILTLLSYPTFDIQQFSDGLTEKEWKNLISSKYKPLFNKTLYGLYPPGSIYKIIVSIAALNEGVVSPYQKIYSGGYFEIGKWRYRNWNPAGCGSINLIEALEQSCDTYYYQVGLKLGVDNIAKYTYMFGIGEKLNPDIEGAISRVPTPQWKEKTLNEGWFLGDTVNLSIGQGYLAITPFDSTKLLVPIVNNGKVLKPILLKAYYDNKTDTLVKNRPEVLKKLPVNNSYYKYVKQGLYMVVYGSRGTAKVMREAVVKNAGKTGTAQVRKKVDKKEKVDRWDLQNHAWFIDFFPYNNPEYITSVFVEHGQTSRVAAEITRDIINDLYDKKILK